MSIFVANQGLKHLPTCFIVDDAKSVLQVSLANTFFFLLQFNSSKRQTVDNVIKLAHLNQNKLVCLVQGKYS